MEKGEGLPLIPSMTHDAGITPPRPWRSQYCYVAEGDVVSREKGNRHGVLRTLLKVAAVFVVASTAGHFYADRNELSARRISKSSSGNERQPVEGSRTAQSFVLIPPYFHRSKHPTFTSTGDCSGDKTLPVLAGVDVVAYFSLEAGDDAVFGRDDIRARHSGYLFSFVSTENRNLFNENPPAFLPAFGGFCAYGISAEDTWTAENLGPFADPSQWAVSNGRLFVFRSATPKERFLEDKSAHIVEGDERWSSWFGDEEGPLNTGCFCSTTICEDK